jgi:hypothetical protein
MSKHRGARETRKQDRHIRLWYWFMDTPAWKTLPPAARAVYVGLLRHYNGFNNGKIGYSVRQASAEAVISRDTAHRALDLLQRRGFIVLMTKGAFSRKARHATEWRLTEYPCDVTGSALATKEFTRWQAGQDLETGTTSRTTRSDRKDRSVLPVGQNNPKPPPTVRLQVPWRTPTVRLEGHS